MSLLVDGNISTIESLRVYDSSILAVCSVEQIDLDAKLRLAGLELESELRAVLARECPASFTGTASEATGLGRVVVTEPLRQWHRIRTLGLVYRDAYFSQLNDRYRGRWQEYARLDALHAALLLDSGIGMAADPLPRPSAPVASLADGPLPPAVYYFRVSWLNSAGQESEPSLVTSLLAEQFHQLSVTAPDAPPNVVSWHLYSGSSLDSLQRQNSEALSVDTVWQASPEGLANAGPPPGEGQAPDSFVRLRRARQRG